MKPSRTSVPSPSCAARPVLVFDFDGTVALGDGPVLAYARNIADELAQRGSDSDARAVLVAVRAALAVGGTENLDGYDAVRRIAEAHGADQALLDHAYLASRADLGTAAAPVSAPAGLAAFLEEADAERILVTNAPAIRIPETLAVLGLGDAFDRVVTAAGKPEGLGAVLDALPEGAAVLSVGDIWRNDLAPAHARGHDTALVGPFADLDADPTLRAADTTSLLPALRDWLAMAARPLSPVPETPHRTTHSEG